MPRICPPPVSASKKNTGQYSAAHAALGGRTLKTGQSRCFVGYKKHTLRLWLHHYSRWGAVGAAGQLGDAGQCFRGRIAGSQPALLPAAMGLVSAAGRGGHGVFGGGRPSNSVASDGA